MQTSGIQYIREVLRKIRERLELKEDEPIPIGTYEVLVDGVTDKVEIMAGNKVHRVSACV